VGEGDKHVELQPMWENPKKVREVIQDDQVVFVARETKDRRSP
jgi:hypothetical protein